MTSLPETAKRVRAARAYAGLTICELADRLGVGVQTIKRVEAGRRTVRTYELIGIAECCGLPREFFQVDFAQVKGTEPSLAEAVARIAERVEALVEHAGLDHGSKA